MSYREKLPLTMKSCFYPLIGDAIFGWIGDFIDVFSIMATLFRVCTSLGLGARQVAKGLSVLNSSIDAESIPLQVKNIIIRKQMSDIFQMDRKIMINSTFFCNHIGDNNMVYYCSRHPLYSIRAGYGNTKTI